MFELIIGAFHKAQVRIETNFCLIFGSQIFKGKNQRSDNKKCN